MTRAVAVLMELALFGVLGWVALSMFVWCLRIGMAWPWGA